jgi:hypothetical protein
MKAELGRRVLDHVTAHRDQFRMRMWGTPGLHGCGTRACLGGWALLLCGYRLEDKNEFIRPDGTEVPPAHVGREAAYLLRLTSAEQFGPDDDLCSLFGEMNDDAAIERFRLLVEAAEAEAAK